MRAFGEQVDFGRTAADYAIHRAGFPPAFFEALTSRNYVNPNQTALDLGTGTGTVARGLAMLGCNVTGLDPSSRLLAQANTLDQQAGANVTYRTGTAEATGLADGSYDLITAGQCWHWFDRAAAAQEVHRLLRPGGRVIIAHFDWLPLPGTVVAATEALILKHNPNWAGAGGTGIYPDWLTDLAKAGFHTIETASFDVNQPYSHAAWHGRVRACAGVSASLSAKAVERFDNDLALCLHQKFSSDPLTVPHRIWWATGLKP